MKHYIIHTILVLRLFGSNTSAQNLIGKSKDEIATFMKTHRSDFEKVKVINESYNYLKYQDALGEQTILFFLSKNDICTSIKLMSHYVHLGKEIAELNEKYESLGNNKWKYSDAGKDYQVELQKGQWFFSIITKPVE